jgi:ADP-heptose:LPS heptosyltransferase/SAM-dependent methyltransferase
MWLIQAPEKIYGTPTGTFFGVQFVNGYATIERWHDYYFLMEKGFEDVTPDEFKNKHNELKRVLVSRDGGIGDVLFAEPLIRGIKQKFPKCEITFQGNKNGIETLTHNPNISNFIPVPYYRLDKYFDQYDDVFDLSLSIEHNFDGEYENAYKLTCDRYGIEPLDGYKPNLYLSMDEMRDAKKTLHESFKIPKNELIIGVAFESTSPLRSFPRLKEWHLLEQLTTLGHVVMFGANPIYKERTYYSCECGHEDAVIFGGIIKEANIECPKCSKPQSIKKIPRNSKIHFALGLPSIRHVYAMINETDIMITVDCGLMNVAGALEKPLIALFGSHNGDLRTRYFKNCVTMQIQDQCGPCNLHHVPACPRMERDGLQEPPCSQLFNVENIFEKTKTLLALNGKSFESENKNPVGLRLERQTCPLCHTANWEHVCRKRDVVYNRCYDCNGIFSMAFPHMEAYQMEDYHRIFESPSLIADNMQYAANLADRFEKILKRKGSILEIGCSFGHTLEGFNKKNWAVYGLEISTDVVNSVPYSFKKSVIACNVENELTSLIQSQWNHPISKGPFLKIKQEDDTEKLILRKNGFDVVLLQHTFEHFINPNKMLPYLKELLSSDGLLVIVGPSSSAFKEYHPGQNTHLNTFVVAEHQYIPSQKSIMKIADSLKLKIVGYMDHRPTGSMEAILQNG